MKKIYGLLIIASLVVCNTVYAVWPYSVTFSPTTGNTILADHINTSNNEHINNNIPESIDDYSVNATEMQALTDPFPAAAISLATTLAEELGGIRHVLQAITQETYWYIDPPAFCEDSAAYTHGAFAADFGVATSFEITNSAAPTVDTQGELALDTTITGYTDGLLTWFGTEANYIVSFPIDTLTVADGDVLAYSAVRDQFEMGTPNVESLVINGDMKVAQRGTSFATLSASQYTLDRMEWIDSGTTDGAVTITQDADVPTAAQAGVKFMNSLKIAVTTAETIDTGDEAMYLSYKIEAQDCTFFGHGAASALSGTLSFWFNSSVAGTFTVNVDRNDASEKYSTEFTSAGSGTWERHSVVIPGDTDGTAIADDNGIGLALQFMLAVGATGKTSTADAWNANGATELATSSQDNFLSAAATVFITGIQYRQGSISGIFKPRSIADVLAKCKRYYERLNSAGTASYQYAGVVQAITTTTARMAIGFTEKRAAATVTMGSAAADFQVWQADNTAEAVSGLVFSQGTVTSVLASITVAANLVAGDATRLADDGGGSSFIAISSEL